ncbi:TPA: hypothetical protein RPW15_001863 [Campylobacter fetus subsp. venerealis]|uniref:DUF1018 domain-containing protein n=1 Tax=Campylobacter fetus subsp. venerealis NCTC 10354 TaxID=983328 RepID=A0AAE6IY47_CAMFE|nr:hypothetical protein [Campylobacter fetus]OCS25328.1 hypothetical protein CFVB10_09000 [Campylobacter fetus subsp. venerealis cfvB10]OCS29075.1 hypothetical protein CFVCCUG33900_08210 [Campylobacter fetus subsp. venerealis LMG 6570 = CCUG 33900]AIR80155.1 hypothetical protein CFV97608_0492 [Campylobacter fetus subsp. venerealis 97/608]EAK0836198.1 hypothetical protein [Campylobacter fetus]MBK3487631.1 hypothetical protein [Campylobacter fetus subsp. venerealis]
MTEKQTLLRRQLLSKIHTTKRYKELKENDAWETFLDCYFGATSSAVLSIKELENCLDLLYGKSTTINDIDLKGRELIARAKKELSSPSQANRLKNAMVRLGWSEEMLKSFVVKKLKIIADPFKMNVKNTSKLIFILEKIKKR